MRRRAPRPLGAALEAVTAHATPAGLLARVQSCWRDVAGDVVAEEAEPTAEHEGVVTVSCRSSVWAQELELLAGGLVEGLNGRLGDPASPKPLKQLRFVTGPRAGLPRTP